MPDWITDSFKHAPDLLALVIFLFLFLKFTNKLLESHAKRTDEFIATVKDINSENSDARKQGAEIISRNTEAAVRQEIASRDVVECLKKNTTATENVAQKFNDFATAIYKERK